MRLVKFDEDDLDQNAELEETLRRRFETAAPAATRRSAPSC